MRQLGGEKLGPNYSVATRATRIAPMVSKGVVSRVPGGLVGAVVKVSAASSRSFERAFYTVPGWFQTFPVPAPDSSPTRKSQPRCVSEGSRLADQGCEAVGTGTAGRLQSRGLLGPEQVINGIEYRLSLREGSTASHPQRIVKGPTRPGPRL